tara:strand:- start:297 stop:587 length:291 start_codon:yes stop_codon:yes gene_type:complete
MSYITNMYGGQNPVQNKNEKNPNRVLGGLRGQGVDSYSVLGEDGQEKHIPTKAYVQGLEEKIKQQDNRLSMLEKQLRRLSNDQKMDRTAFSRTINN